MKRQNMNTELDLSRIAAMNAEEKAFAARIQQAEGSFRVDRNYELEKKKIESKLNVSGPEILRRQRQSMLEDKNNRFIVNRAERRIHDRNCPLGRKVSDENFGMLQKFDFSYKLCAACRFDVLIASCIEDPASAGKVKKFLEETGAKAAALYSFLLKNRVSVRYLPPESVELQVNEDTWRIVKKADGFHLLHNNYRVFDKRRVFLKSFHEQRLSGERNFKNFAEMMGTYTWDFHLDELKKEEERVLVMAPENEEVLAPEKEWIYPYTAVRLKRFSLFFSYYLLIDKREGIVDGVFAKRGVRASILALGKRESCPYRVVYFKAPRWQRKKVHASVNEVRRKMERAGLSESRVCCRAVMRVLEKNGAAYFLQL